MNRYGHSPLPQASRLVARMRVNELCLFEHDFQDFFKIDRIILPLLPQASRLVARMLVIELCVFLNTIFRILFR